MQRTLLTGLGLVLAAQLAVAQPVIDGSARDPLYGPALVEQDTNTQFGDSTLGRVGTAGGSELDAVYGTIYDGHLYLVFSGNLESNGNNLEIFIDSVAGGQNRLLSTNPASGLTRMSDDPNDDVESGLTFSAGFEADYWVAVNVFGEPTEAFVDYARLSSDLDPGEFFYVGQTFLDCGANGGVLTMGDTGAPDIRVNVDNRNVLGVVGGPEPTALSDEVLTGVEVCIPLSAIGSPTGAIAITAFINSGSHDFASNQFLGGLFGSENLGEPRDIDLNALFQLPVVVTAKTPVGACCFVDSCDILTEATCIGSGGVYQGDNTTCLNAPCDEAPTGSCCVYDATPGGECFVSTEAGCTAEGGVWTLGGDCFNCPCEGPPTGACCLPDGTCDLTTEAGCIAEGGSYAGDFTNCDSNPCDAGACCVDGACSETLRFECDALGGRLLFGQDCTGEPCAFTITTPHLAGTFEDPPFQPTTLPMMMVAPNIWELEIQADPNSRHEFKVTNGLDWADPNHVNLPGSNAWVYADPNGLIVITYDANPQNDGWVPTRDRLYVNTDLGDFVAVGNWQSEAGEPSGDWVNDSTVTAMTPTGDPGIYSYAGGPIPAGTYQWKAVRSGIWEDGITGESRSNFAEIDFTVEEGDTFEMFADSLLGRLRIEITPTTPTCLCGDVNNDGAVNAGDIDCFVQAVVSGTPCDADCSLEAADTNADGVVNAGDIDSFVDAVVSGACL